MFEDFEDWEIYAIRDGEFLTTGLFRQTYPDDAVAILMSVVRLRFDINVTAWAPWTFWCVARHREGQLRRTRTFAVSPSGRPTRLAESPIIQRDAGTFPIAPVRDDS